MTQMAHAGRATKAPGALPAAVGVVGPIALIASVRGLPGQSAQARTCGQLPSTPQPEDIAPTSVRNTLARGTALDDDERYQWLSKLKLSCTVVFTCDAGHEQRCPLHSGDHPSWNRFCLRPRNRNKQG